MHDRNLVSYIYTGKNIAMYKNMAPMKISAAKKAEVTGRWRKVDNKETENLYSLSSVKHSRMI